MYETCQQFFGCPSAFKSRRSFNCQNPEFHPSFLSSHTHLYTTFPSTMETEKQKMIAGKPYDASDPELRADMKAVRDKITTFNHSAHGDAATRKRMIDDIFGTCGAHCFIEPPLSVDYGYNIHLGKNVYANFNCVFLDCAPITVGDNTMFGPNVQVYTASHPLDAVERCSGIEFAKPIKIGDMCWIGGAAIICPGVTIGDR